MKITRVETPYGKLYTADVGVLSDESEFAAYYAKMPEFRRKKIDRYRFKKDKRLSLGAGILLSAAVDEMHLRDSETGECPKAAVGPEGKPYFPEYPDLHFNLSHSGTKVFLAVSEYEIGCDVEELPKKPDEGSKLPHRPTKSFEDVISRYYTPAEQALFSEIDRSETLSAAEKSEEKRDLFTRIWALKESYMKCTGRGLTVSPETFSVLPTEAGIRFIPEPKAEGKYAFYEYTLSDDCKYAVCIRK